MRAGLLPDEMNSRLTGASDQDYLYFVTSGDLDDSHAPTGLTRLKKPSLLDPES